MSFDLKIIEAPEDRAMSELEPGEELMLRGLRGMALEGAGAEISPELEKLGLAAVERSLAKERGRATRLWAAGGTLLAAAGALLALVVRSEQDPTATLSETSGTVETRTSTSGQWSRLRQGDDLVEGATVRTQQASAALLSISPEISVRLKALSEIRLSEGQSRAFRVQGGSAAFSVRQLKNGDFFLLEVQGATIRAEETEFTVTILEEGAAPCIVVIDGSVEFEGPNGKVQLNAGRKVGCELPREKISQPAAAQVDIVDVTAAHEKLVPTKRQARAPEMVASTLSEENELFQKALLAQRAGRIKEARSLLDSFISKYPDSPLGAQVRAQRSALMTGK